MPRVGDDVIAMSETMKILREKGVKGYKMTLIRLKMILVDMESCIIDIAKVKKKAHYKGWRMRLSFDDSCESLTSHVLDDVQNFGSRTDTVFCGVFDGHGPYGHVVARRVRDSLPLKLSAHWEVNISNDSGLRENGSPGGSMNSEETSLLLMDEQPGASTNLEEKEKHPEIFLTLKESFLKAFKVMDKELRLHPNIDCFCSGTTAVTLVKQGQDLIIGNIGDSRAILGTRDQDDTLVAVQLTVDLKPNLPKEAERIRQCKGRVFALQDEPEVARVWLPNYDSPGLAMARAFGDFCLKDFGLISVPEISYRRLTEKDEFIVLATDGVFCKYTHIVRLMLQENPFRFLFVTNRKCVHSVRIWDVLSNKEVVDIVASAPVRSSASRVLVETAVRAWRCKYPTSKVDDCAVVCLFLDSDSSNLKMKEISEKLEDPSNNPVMTEQSADIQACHEILPEAAGQKQVVPTDEPVDEWSALEGVSRVNTLLTLPRFVAGEDPKSGRKRS
ncbi:hypothetical protein ACLOJK_023061 [Asimina triloba]